MKTKKGDIFQIVFVIIMILIMAVLALLIGKLSYEVTQQYKSPALGLAATPTGTQANQLMQSMSVPLLDFFILFFFLGSNIGLIVSAIKTKYSPTIIFLFILLLLIEILLASGVVNIYQGFHNEASLAPIPSQMVLTNALLSKYFPLIVSVIGAVVLIFMYSKQDLSQ